MAERSVYVQIPLRVDVTDDDVEQVCDAIGLGGQPYHASVSATVGPAGQARVGAQMWVEAHAGAAMGSASGPAGGRSSPATPSNCACCRGRPLKRSWTRRRDPTWSRARRAAQMLGFTRQRVHQLATDHPSFPAPVYELGVGKLWLRSTLAMFDRQWERRTGRPPKQAVVRAVEKTEWPRSIRGAGLSRVVVKSEQSKKGVIVSDKGDVHTVPHGDG